MPPRHPNDNHCHRRTPLKYFIGIALGTTALTLGIQGLGALQFLEWTVLDQWVRNRPAEPWDSPVVIVAIDEQDVEASGNWPLTDRQLAQLLERIKQHEPAAIGLDLYRDLPIPPGQNELTQVFTTTPNLIVIEKIIGAESGVVIAPPAALKESEQVAFNDFVVDQDGRIRRHLLSMRFAQQTKVALSTKLALLYLKQQFQITPEPLANHRIRLGKATFAPLQPHAGPYINADVGGYQILANPLRLSQGAVRISMQDLLSDRLPVDQLRHKVVLIGLTTKNTWGDRFYTAYSEQGAESWAGVEVHANLVAQLIANAVAGRSQLRTVPEPLEWVWILVWASIGVAANQVLAINWRLLRLPLIMGGLGLTTFGLFLGQYWLPLIAPLCALSSAWLITQGCLIWEQLRHENQRLEQIVVSRTQELRSKNQELEQARLEANKANQAKSNFLAHISHELRTPLTAILGFGDLLEHSPNLPATEKEHAETINRSGEHLLALINNVLELSKIEAGSITLTPETVHLPTLFHDIEQMFQTQAMAKQLDLQLELADTTPTWIEVDGGKLRQIVINLVGNAVKFTTAGQVVIQTQAYSPVNRSQTEPAQPLATPGTTCSLECAVTDTGPGLTSTELEQIFQPFVQTNAGKNLRKGTGLGLALVHQWLEAMGGSIEVQSTYGTGSRFVFQLPVQIPVAPSLPSSPPKTPHLSVEITKNYRVLIVDDQPYSRRLLAQWLADAQFEFETADTGTTALATFASWQPHLILLDVHLPDVDGYEVARRIREQWQMPPQTHQSTWLDHDEPVILALTAGVLQDKYADLLAAGCDDVLWKPLKSDTLFAKIAEYL